MAAYDVFNYLTLFFILFAACTALPLLFKKFSGLKIFLQNFQNL